MKIIPQREILGNYNYASTIREQVLIIPQREILGNYNETISNDAIFGIIPQREILGNYNKLWRGVQLNIAI